MRPTRTARTGAAAATAAIALFFAVPGSASAATCNVPSVGHPTIAAAVADFSCDPIVVAPGTYNESPAVARNVQIQGAGAATTTLDGGASTALTVGTIGPDNAVTMSGFTIAGTGRGVDILEQDALTLTDSVVTGHGATIGAGVNVSAFATFNGTNLTISQNTTSDGSGGGAGILNAGTVNLNQSLLSGNEAAGSGGGFRNAISGANATFTNVTFSDNTAEVHGGGFMSASAGANASLNNVTIATNRADDDENDSGDGAGIYMQSGAATLRNAIVSNNNDDSDSSGDPVADDCSVLGSATLSRGGFVLVEDETAINGAFPCTFSGGADTAAGYQTAVDPVLFGLANNGGPTQTHALRADSPARDKIPAGSCVSAIDQRGVTRPQGPACDLGAFEVEVCNASDGATLTAALADSDCEEILLAPGTYTTAVSFGFLGNRNVGVSGPGAGQATLTRASGGTIVSNSASSLVLRGVTIAGGVGTVGLSIGSTTGTSSILDGVVITGNNTSGSGAAIFSSSPSSNALQMTDSVISNNIASGGQGGGGVTNSGGGLLSFDRVLFSGNQALGSVGGGAASNAVAGAEMKFNNVTFTGNKSRTDGGAIRNGGGTTAVTDLNNVTIAGNTADDDANGSGNGGGVANVLGVVRVSNAIVANNTDKGGEAPNCHATGLSDQLITRRGYELIRDPAGCAFGGSGDIPTGYLTGIDPLLGALTTSSSSLGVLPLQAGSPAINAGNPAAPASAQFTCSAVDQLGATRGPAGTCDLGAAEFVIPQVVTPLTPATPFDLAAAIKKCKKKFKGKKKAKKRKKCIKRAKALATA